MSNELIAELRLAFDAGLVVLIWIVQTIIYPGFRAIDRQRFVAWHASYTRAISRIVGPLILGQALLLAAELNRVPTTAGAISAGLVAIAWISTATLQIPCHRRLSEEGPVPDVIDRLVRSNAIRTVAWSGVFLLGRL